MGVIDWICSQNYKKKIIKICEEYACIRPTVGWIL